MVQVVMVWHGMVLYNKGGYVYLYGIVWYSKVVHTPNTPRPVPVPVPAPV